MDIVAELTRARKVYGTVEALRGVDLTIRRGDVVALLGPNGAGKTTAIGLLLGVRRPTSGTARLFGLSPADRRARSRCGVVLQESGVAAVLTVRETIDLFRAYYPAPLRVEAAMALAGLQEKADTRVAALSGGERQRLYFALAVCGDPELLFLDEPTVGMDVEARHLFLEALRGFVHSGKTIVLTTHYLEEADQLAGRLVVIDRGVVIADGAPAAIKARVPGRRITFRVKSPIDAGVLHGLPAERVAAPPGRISLLSNEPEATLRALFARGVEVTELEVVGATLEEALLTLPRPAAPESGA